RLREIRDPPCRHRTGGAFVLVAAGILIGLVAGAVVGVLVVRSVGASQVDKALRTRQQLLQDAEREAEAKRREARVEAREEAVKHRLERSEDLIRHELARQVRQMEEEARTEAKRRARNLVADALQRVAASHAAETTVTLVELPSDDMKGRIIGREGRNIRAL